MNNAQGVETLGMGDFTLRKIHEQIVPGASSNWTWNVTINSPYRITVPGYKPDECIVIISPLSYYGSAQGSNGAISELRTPVYVDLGGEDIGIIRYCNEDVYDSPNGRWLVCSRWGAMDSVVEVYKVYGG
ncbi:hypothetical protein IB239_21895 [Pseudomonas sp. PDM12]|uniref:hypothetical protein n=1 Tax=Pseudomonas sp. PDM12 TaxID=2769260 RepID=UPI00177BE321|nr:hypothetical protein [Pseudomonas sp. PDM12]MBD9657489.1 hypothetical protein [Pseudomonas sp. PDM12]